MANDKKNKPSKIASYVRYRANTTRALIIPYIFVSYPLAGIIIGWFLDSKFKTAPWLLVVFLILGMVEAFRELLKIAKQSEEDYAREDKEAKEQNKPNE
jgi:F0F1-type ATP synthase assembly protein I